MENQNTYQPVNCAFYDYLEHYATLRKPVHIEYLEEGIPTTLKKQIIQDLSGGRKGEYVHLLVNGKEKRIRADRLIAVDGVRLSDFPSRYC